MCEATGLLNGQQNAGNAIEVFSRFDEDSNIGLEQDDIKAAAVIKT